MRFGSYHDDSDFLSTGINIIKTLIDFKRRVNYKSKFIVENYNLSIDFPFVRKYMRASYILTIVNFNYFRSEL